MCIYEHIKIFKEFITKQWLSVESVLEKAERIFHAFFLQLKNSRILSDYRHGVFCYSWYLKNIYRASLVVQWLRICLPLQGTQVWIPGQGRFQLPQGN